MKQRTFILTFLLIVATFLGCHNNKAQGYVETKNENSEKKVCTVPCERNDTILWDNWFKENHKWYIHIFDETKEKHTKTINDLLSLFYTGNDSLRNNYRMIEWRLDRFYPIIDDTSNELGKYNNIEKQIDSLLNFEVDKNSYAVRRKSALTRLMYELRLKMLEDKLRNSIEEPEIQQLLDQEIKLWYQYSNATSDAFEKIVLRKENYYLKATFGNNYDFDIMNQRIKSLLYLYFKDPLTHKSCYTHDWKNVEYGYKQIQKNIKLENDTDYEYSYEEQNKSLSDDKNTFTMYMEIHSALLKKLGLDDNGYMLDSKVRILEKFLDGYDTIDSLKF